MKPKLAYITIDQRNSLGSGAQKEAYGVKSILPKKDSSGNDITEIDSLFKTDKPIDQLAIVRIPNSKIPSWLSVIENTEELNTNEKIKRAKELGTITKAELLKYCKELAAELKLQNQYANLDPPLAPKAYSITFRFDKFLNKPIPIDDKNIPIERFITSMESSDSENIINEIVDSRITIVKYITTGNFTDNDLTKHREKQQEYRSIIKAAGYDIGSVSSLTTNFGYYCTIYILEELCGPTPSKKTPPILIDNNLNIRR